MITIVSYYIGLAISIYILFAVYYYCIKTYGVKATLIAQLLTSFMVLSLMFSGAYGAAELGTDLDFDIYWITDPISIFSVFVVVFELARFSLKKMKGTELTYKDIISVSILTTIYGISLQLIMDPTAAALGHYYYLNPPPINIFGYPIWFITAFGIYGLYGFIILTIERHYFRKTK